ncbi:hemerythrin domain-containing protein [Sphingomonas sp.]|jgi:hemerythrin superfamily protein|uniref:hemerythrin domain-containing protein n=1 Tax=Sphingomonas sp. TaxID=28214 RepID=UPI002DEC87D2|nr:hemerythrin domain-containing protein [Sphingomonas sp.]
MTPLVSDETRLRARENARTQALPNRVVQLIIDDHNRIERAFEAVRSASTAESQRGAELELANLLNGHAAAEETVIYPELVDNSQHGAAFMGYEEQAATKVQLALLSKLEPLTQDYLDKLEHIRGAVTHHMYQEENSWLVTLERGLLSDDRVRVRARYKEEMRRFAAPAAENERGEDERSVMSWGGAWSDALTG